MSKKRAKAAGRPKKTGPKREERIPVQVTMAEKRRYYAAAQKAGVDASTWIRGLCEAAAGLLRVE